MRSNRHHRLLLACLSSALIASAVNCAHNKKKQAGELTRPDVIHAVTHFSGTPLSGPTSRPVSDTALADASSVHVTWIAIEQMPLDLSPISATARLISSAGASEPMLSSGRVTQRLRLVPPADAEAFRARLQSGQLGRTVDITSETGILAAGSTVSFRLEEKGDASKNLTLTPDHRLIVLSISSPGAPTTQSTTQPTTQATSQATTQSASQPAVPPTTVAVISVPATTTQAASGTTVIQMGIGIDDLVVPPRKVDLNDTIDAQEKKPSRDRKPPPAPAAVWQRERMLLDPLAIPKQSQFALVTPVGYSQNGARALVAMIEIAPLTSSADDQKLLTKGRAELALSAQKAASRPAVVVDPLNYSLIAALQTLGQGTRPRSSLVFLAAETNARLCEEVALVADENAVGQLAERVSEKAKKSADAVGKDQLAWILDGSCFELLAEMQGASKLPPELAAVLTAYAGEAGRNASSLEEINRNLSGRDELDARLIAENLIYLEDTAPAARVRAYDWLHVRGRAPQGYDPLASNKQRRDALDKTIYAPPPAPGSTITPPGSPTPVAPAGSPIAPVASPTPTSAAPVSPTAPVTGDTK